MPLPVFVYQSTHTVANILNVARSSYPYLPSTLKRSNSLTNGMNDRDYHNAATSIINRTAMSLPLPSASRKPRATLKHQPFCHQRCQSQSIPYLASHSPPWFAPTSLPLCHLCPSSCGPPLPRYRYSPMPSHPFFRQTRTL
jgi:hypothetical protein